MKKIIPAALSLSLAVLFSVCSSRSYREAMKEPEKLFYQGKFLEAGRMLLPEVNSSGKDQLLFMMECGLMLHTGAEYKTSNQILLKAGEIARVIPTSITQQVGSLLTNEGSTNYKGEDFEKVLVHMYLGINFIMLKDYDAARVEFKLVNEELTKIRDEGGKVRYKMNLMAKYLTAIASEMIAEVNNDDEDREFAYVEYKQINSLAPNLELAQRDLQLLAKKLKYDDDYGDLKKKFGRKDDVPSPYGELVLIFQAGRSAIKVSRGKLLEDKAMNGSINVTLNSGSLKAGVTIAAVMITLKTAENPIPKFEKRSNLADYARVLVNGKTYDTIELENIEETAVKNLEDDYGRLRAKVAASIVTKAVVSIAAGLAAKKLAEQSKKLGAFSGLIGMAAGVGTGAALFSQM